MSTKKIQILNSTVKQAQNADTLDGMHADEFATPSDLMDCVQVDLEDATEGVIAKVNADTFNGYTIDKFVMFNVTDDDSGDFVEYATVDYVNECITALRAELTGGTS